MRYAIGSVVKTGLVLLGSVASKRPDLLSPFPGLKATDWENFPFGESTASGQFSRAIRLDILPNLGIFFTHGKGLDLIESSGLEKIIVMTGALLDAISLKSGVDGKKIMSWDVL